MPKNEIDYSNTIIYKITCKDANVNDVYVGHTTNFVQRKHAHKQSCINIKSHNYKCKIYEVIRNNGGWNNWSMEIINFFNCRDHYEARQKEQEYFVLLNATLNSIEPMPKPKIKSIKVGEKGYYKYSKQTSKKTEKMEMPKNADFYCEICDFICCKKSNYEIHCKTKKHINRVNGNEMENAEIKKNAIYECKCGKTYRNASGLWKHNKKDICLIEKKPDDKNDKLIEYLMKENKEIKEMILEIVKNGSHNTINNTNTHTNSHNKAFNLNFFLNETCKNAMNITDFVDSIKLQLSDLIDVGELGYVEGISKIIVKNLNNLDETIRPVHCTDKKRETMYIKDEGEWNKEDEKKTKLKKAVTKVADKNIRLLPAFREKYPEYKNSSSKTSDKYDKMVLEVMTCDDDKNEKIITNISKVTTIKE
jgi:hypothetical protein